MATKGRSDLLTNIASGEVLHASQIEDIVDGSLNLNDDTSLLSNKLTAIYKTLGSANAGLNGLRLGSIAFVNNNGGVYSYWFEGSIAANGTTALTGEIVLDSASTFNEVSTYVGTDPIMGQVFVFNTSNDMTSTFQCKLDSTGIKLELGTTEYTPQAGDIFGLNLVAVLGART